jgi:cytochrome bd-type quinol oxidase subunit 2
MLIWYANMPEETEWFIRRNTESWNSLNLFLVIGRFFVPFALLLIRAPKRNARKLCLIAGWIVFMQLVDIYIVVLPMLYPAGLHITIWDFPPLIGMGATLAFFYLRILARTSLFPNRDPRLLESLRTTN